MFQVTGAFAEFERSMIRQRVNAGLKRAVEQGKRLGRPKVSRKSRAVCGPKRAPSKSHVNVALGLERCSESSGNLQRGN
jgi:DNA invertase Pin-like site-specific DNA recombinase